jgi:hypothetical protein
MARYYVEFQLGTTVEADSEDEAIEKASDELRNPDYDNVNVTLEEILEGK